MPVFPRAHSDRALTTKQPRALDQKADIRTDAADRTKVATDALSDMTAATQKWQQHIDKLQKDTALYNYKVGAQEISNEAVLNQDLSKRGEYFKRIENLKKEVTKGLPAGVVNSMTPELDYYSNMTTLGVEHEFRTKEIYAGIAIGTADIQFQVNNPTPESEKLIAKRAERMVKEDLINEKEAYKLIADATDDVRFNRFLMEYREDPVAAEKKFNSKEYAMTITTREKAFSKLKELKRLYREAENDRYQNMGLDIMTGTLSEDTIDQQMAMNERNPNEGITLAHGKQLKKALYRDVKSRIGAEQYKKTKKAIDFVFSDSEYNKIKMYESVLAAYADGLDADDSKMLNEITRLKKDKAWRAKNGIGHNLVEMFFDMAGWSPDKDLERRTEAVLNYGRKIVSGMDPEQAGKEVVIDELKKEHPALVVNENLDATFSPTKGFRSVTPKPEKGKK